MMRRFAKRLMPLAAAAALMLVPSEVRADNDDTDCTDAYMVCLNEALTKYGDEDPGLIGELAYLECMTKWVQCVAGAFLD